MASPLVQASIETPGFFGLNTEQHAAKSQERFATELTNAIFDEAGKVACRKGFDPTVNHENTITDLYWWRKDATTSKLMAFSGDEGGRLFEVTQTTNPYDTMTNIGALNSFDNMAANVNGHLVIGAPDVALMYWDGTTIDNFAAATGTTSNPTGGIILSAFGRLFATTSDKKTVLGSELAPDPSTGIDWDNWFIDTTGASGGSAKDGWTFGRDYITALGAIGDLLVIFGLESILVYKDINGTVTLADSISGVGCISKHSVRNVGDDIYFLSNSGVRSLRRTLERESPALNDISAFVRGDLLHTVTAADVHTVHAELDGFYLLADGEICYMWDLRQEMPGGERRASKWTLTPNGMTYDPESNTLFLAVGSKVGIYRNYQDDGESYKLTLKSAWLDLQSQGIKIIKKLSAIIYGGDGYTPQFSVAFDYDENGEEHVFAEAIPFQQVSEWNVGLWNVAKWSQSKTQISRRYVQASGSGLYVRYGIEFNVDQFEVGIQEVNMSAKVGKLAHV